MYYKFFGKFLTILFALLFISISSSKSNASNFCVENWPYIERYTPTGDFQEYLNKLLPGPRETILGYQNFILSGVERAERFINDMFNASRVDLSKGLTLEDNIAIQEYNLAINSKLTGSSINLFTKSGTLSFDGGISSYLLSNGKVVRVTIKSGNFELKSDTGNNLIEISDGRSFVILNPITFKFVDANLPDIAEESLMVVGIQGGKNFKKNATIKLLNDVYREYASIDGLNMIGYSIGIMSNDMNSRNILLEKAIELYSAN